MRVVVGISGATGAVYGWNLLRALKSLGVETHVVVSKWAQKTLEMEMDKSLGDLLEMASYHYDLNNLSATISSGSFLTAGMVIAPCSMKTLAGIAHGYDENLIVRAADVTLKEQRKLILVPRETPLTAIHLQNMLNLARLGVVMMPPMPAFYNRPQSLEEIVNHTIARVLDQLGIEHNLAKRWGN